MRVLFVGGTGNISMSVTRLLAERGADLTVLNRGVTEPGLPAGVRSIAADIRDVPAAAAALRGRPFDVVVDWIAFTPEQVRADMSLFPDVGQYVFISSATVYQKPGPVFPYVETAPLGNPGWQYAADKLACEELLRAESNYPSTIIRPSHTFGESRIPTAVDGEGYLIVDRLRRGKPVVVHDDGSSLWTMTHSADFARAFAGLLGNEAALGESFHLTSDFVLTWDEIIRTIAAAAGFEAEIVHVPSEVIASVDPGLGVGLICDKAHSLVFDNTKLKSYVPGFEARVSFAEGVARSLEWFEADPARCFVDTEREALLDRILAAS